MFRVTFISFVGANFAEGLVSDGLTSFKFNVTRFPNFTPAKFDVQLWDDQRRRVNRLHRREWREAVEREFWLRTTLPSERRTAQ
jgi:hypothetical protein